MAEIHRLIHECTHLTDSCRCANCINSPFLAGILRLMRTNIIASRSKVQQQGEKEKTGASIYIVVLLALPSCKSFMAHIQTLIYECTLLTHSWRCAICINTLFSAEILNSHGKVYLDKPICKIKQAQWHLRLEGKKLEPGDIEDQFWSSCANFLNDTEVKSKKGCKMKLLCEARPAK